MATQTTNSSNRNSKNRFVALLLAVFLGDWGIHKFYLGQVGWGILYILFSWTFIPMIVGWIEALMYLTMSDKEFQSKYS
jgi:TM2 domain-containing membrane protein YozV